jgi:hypothetical protein
VDRRRNDYQYVILPNGRLTFPGDGDGNGLDPNPGCELVGNCDSDGKPDVDPKTGLPIFEEIERSHEYATTRTYDLAARIDGAIDPDEQGHLVLLATPTYLHTIGVNGTPRGNDRNITTDTIDATGTWTSRLLGGALQLDAFAGWHHHSSNEAAIDPLAAMSPAVQYDRSDLGSVALNSDLHETPRCVRSAPTAIRRSMTTSRGSPTAPWLAITSAVPVSSSASQTIASRHISQPPIGSAIIGSPPAPTSRTTRSS